MVEISENNEENIECTNESYPKYIDWFSTPDGLEFGFEIIVRIMFKSRSVNISRLQYILRDTFGTDERHVVDPSHKEHLDELKKQGCASCKSTNVEIEHCYYTGPLTFTYKCVDCEHKGSIRRDRIPHITGITGEDYFKAKQNRVGDTWQEQEENFQKAIKELGAVTDYGPWKIN